MSTAHPDLIVDPGRTDRHEQTGIYVRAKHQDKWGSYDIAELTRESLIAWLQAGAAIGLGNKVVVILLDHEPLDTQNPG